MTQTDSWGASRMRQKKMGMNRFRQAHASLRRQDRSRGAAAVEAAVVTPLLLLLFFGILEYGLRFRDELGATNASRDGARTASVAGRDFDADYRTVREVARSAAALDEGDIRKIVIFKASGPNDTVPPACEGLSGGQGVADVCNVYDPTHFAYPLSEFGCNPAANPRPDPDRHWCPDSRVVSVAAGLDYIGVYMEVDFTYATGLFGDTDIITQTAILKVEPEAQ